MANKKTPKRTAVVDDVVETQPELNPALEALEEIVIERPNLTQEEWETVSKAADWLKLTMKPGLLAELEIDYAKRYALFQAEMRVETQRLVQDSMKQWREDQEPLGQDELKTLLQQEYTSEPVVIPEMRGDKILRHFTIVELPQSIEEEFIKLAQARFIPFIEAVNSAEFTLDGTIVEQINTILKQVPAALSVAAELATLCLNPWKEHDFCTVQWVKDNMSTFRITNILIAQSEANKYRDFFSNGSRSFRSLMKK